MRVVIDHPQNYVAMSPAKPEPIICWEKGKQAETGSGGMDRGVGRTMERTWGSPAVTSMLTGKTGAVLGPATLNPGKSGDSWASGVEIGLNLTKLCFCVQAKEG